MKDKQVDLCGQIGIDEDEVLPVLSKDETFSFACNGCGGCCRGREDIVLSGYDLFRIAAHFRLPPAVAINAFCRQYIGENSALPVVRIQPRDAHGGDCPFLYENRCAIHDVEPLVCALYPLGQEISLDGTVSYFAQTVHCGGTVYEAKLGDFLQRYDIAAREAFDVQWAFACIRLAKQMQALSRAVEEGRCTKAQLRAAHKQVFEALYTNYDCAQAYAPQFDANLARIERYLARVLHFIANSRAKR